MSKSGLMDPAWFGQADPVIAMIVQSTLSAADQRLLVSAKLIIFVDVHDACASAAPFFF